MIDPQKKQAVLNHGLRIFLMCGIGLFSGLLITTWQADNAIQQKAKRDQEQALAQALTSDIPQAILKNNSNGSPNLPQDLPDNIANLSAPKIQKETIPTDRLIQVETDLLSLSIDKKGGNIVHAVLKAYPKDRLIPNKGYTVLNHSEDRYYVAQSGLIHEQGPDLAANQAVYQSGSPNYTLSKDQKTLEVNLDWTNPSGVQFRKSFIFHKGSYLIGVKHQVKNTTPLPWQATLYAQLKQAYQGKKSGRFLGGVQEYIGGAIYSPEKPFKKIPFETMDKEVYSKTNKGGWVAMLEHYFLSAWIPDKTLMHNYYTKVYPGKQYAIGSVTNVVVPAHTTKVFSADLYLGPEKGDVLKAIHPGLNLTIDYGILWPIAQPLFFCLKTIYSVIHNWGWSIVLVTLLIKLLFYNMSAKSTRSMLRVKAVQPKIEQLKMQYGEDKQKLNVAMMELYKKEKINPLGALLPMLIQIPVFIALYYVLLESIELRQAPFIFWIKDLSIKDPYYVLPIIMGATMLLQQKLNPPPADPMQAKMMMAMPVIFTVLFVSMPAGLILYWVVNNILSMAQQSFITSRVKS